MRRVLCALKFAALMAAKARRFAMISVASPLDVRVLHVDTHVSVVETISKSEHITQCLASGVVD